MGSTTSGFRVPSNRVTAPVDGPEYFQIGSNATIAKMKPGVGVELDGAGKVKEFDGTGQCIGILGYEDVQPGDYKPATRDTAFGAIGNRVPVIVAVGVRVRARLAASQTVGKGMLLQMGSDGLLSLAATSVSVTGGAQTITYPVIYAKADEAVTTDANGAGTAIWVITK